MISLSKVFKPHQYIPVEEIKKIEYTHPLAASEPEEAKEPAAEEAPDPARELDELKQQMLRDAEAAAEQQLRNAAQEAKTLRKKAREEIDAWWQEKRREDEQRAKQAQDAGYAEGYRAGVAEAEAKVRQEYAAMLDEARSIIEQATQTKQRIIQESEPFLIELACGIAEKIVGRQLSVQPEWMIELMKRMLARRREKGVITLCVSPSQFPLIQNARDELSCSIDSLAELEIIPDTSVRDHGCIVRSSFGSIDARIDTQLDEIKAALLQIAEQSKEEIDDV